MKTKAEFKEELKNKECSEIFSEVNKRMGTALMLHSSMSDYFSFIGLHGFKRMHEYQYYSESIGKRKLHHFYLDQTNMLLEPSGHDKVDIIPKEWYKHTRMDITSGVMTKAVKQAFDTYKQWEEETYCMYSVCAIVFEEKGELAFADYMRCEAEEVQHEIKKLYRIICPMSVSEYDWMYILDIQDKLHDKYKKCLKKLF